MSMYMMTVLSDKGCNLLTYVIRQCFTLCERISNRMPGLTWGPVTALVFYVRNYDISMQFIDQKYSL